MRRTSAPTHEPAAPHLRIVRGDEWIGSKDGKESRSAEAEPRTLEGLGRLVEPPVEASVKVIERVASVLRMGSLRTW